MDLNNYNQVMSNVGALNNQVANAQTAAENAKNKIWSLEGYLLKQKLSEA